MSNLCKTITLEVTQKWLYWTGGLLQNTCRGLLLMDLPRKMFPIFLIAYTEFSRLLCFKSSVLLQRFSANMQQVYWRAPTWKYKFKNTLTWSNDVAQRCSRLSPRRMVAEQSLTVLGKSICINEQAELNIAKAN